MGVKNPSHPRGGEENLIITHTRSTLHRAFANQLTTIHTRGNLRHIAPLLILKRAISPFMLNPNTSFSRSQDHLLLCLGDGNGGEKLKDPQNQSRQGGQPPHHLRGCLDQAPSPLLPNLPPSSASHLATACPNESGLLTHRPTAPAPPNAPDSASRGSDSLLARSAPCPSAASSASGSAGSRSPNPCRSLSAVPSRARHGRS